MDKNRMYYDLTQPQMRVFTTERLNPDTAMFNIGGLLKFYTDLDLDIMEKAIGITIEKHAGMRLQLINNNNAVRQYIQEYVPEKLDYIDFSCYPEPEKELNKWARNELQKKFTIFESPLFRYVLFKVSDTYKGIFFKAHHIICDGWSIIIEYKHLCELYRCIELQKPIPEGLESNYTEYLDKENKYFTSLNFDKHREYWRDKFKDMPDPSLTRGSSSFKSRIKKFVIPEEKTKVIKSFIQEQGLTLNTFGIMCYLIYLNKATGIDDQVIGLPAHNRMGRLKKIYGLFAGYMPFRFDVKGEYTIKDFAADLTKELRTHFHNQKYPYNLLVRDLELNPNKQEQLFKVIVNYHSDLNMDIEQYKLETDIDERFSGEQQESLHIKIREWLESDALQIDYFYKMDEYTENDIDQIHHFFEKIITEIINDSGKKISDIELISAEEKQKILGDYNNTTAPYPENKTIHEVFEDQAQKNPERTALVFNGETMSYRELDQKANRLAHTLRGEYDIKPNSIVGIMAERSFEMMIGILGILKAGGAYLPVDPEFPVDRIQGILKDSNTGLLLTQTRFVDNVVFDGNILDLEDQAIYSSETGVPVPVNAPADLAYIIYTSGSAGKPNGVMIEHRSVINRIHWMQKQYQLTETDALLQKTNFTFDVSVWELFWWFFAGAKLSILKSGSEKDNEALLEDIEHNKVTHVHFVPSMFNTFLEHIKSKKSQDKIKSLKRIFSSGETLTFAHVEKHFALVEDFTGTKLTNLYGPTEATVDVSYYDCNRDSGSKHIPIGKPIDNVKLYICDENSILQPTGIPGELCIGGICLARGYLNRNSLTGEKFINDPFNPGHKMYRTGDLAQWLPDGNIRFLGRIDSQVKIRGFRIELKEVEASMLAHDDIKEAVVVAKEDTSGDNSLCGFYVSDEEISIDELKEFMEKTLPAYMIPSYLTKLESIPLTSNGKVDFRGLPEPTESMLTFIEYQPPRNEMEEKLVTIWKETLGLSKIGINDNFFRLGGHSLKVVNLSSQINEAFDTSLQPAIIYDLPTIKNLSEYIEKNNSSEILKEGI